MKELHLVCNAHLDPVWLWEWEEGAAEALSTFRTAAEFCETTEGFVFNHNEALLYQWVEEYDPALFARIQRLAAAGRWHIMGGWFLQPDCNLPSGESILRQILRGRRYFQEKFGVAPTTAINFDPFGHSRGLVQILRKCGYTSYVVCRAGAAKAAVSGPDFRWRGYDGSELLVHYSGENYNSVKGHAAAELDAWLARHAAAETGLWLWGIGDHGGGPSRRDLRELAAWMAGHPEIDARHSVPEAYLDRLDPAALPLWERSLTPELTGCYVSQIRIKQQHRRLEDQLYSTEKLLSMAAAQGRLAYPQEELLQAERALLESEFHDVLPGSAIQPVEEASLQKIGFGRELLSRLRARALFALSGGQPKAAPGESPILVCNPHPYPIEAIVECELVLPEQNWDGGFCSPVVYLGERRLPTQAGREESSFWIDWRKRAVFRARLEPCSVTRFGCRFERLPARPRPVWTEQNGKLLFCSDELQAELNCRTGTLDRYCRRGREYLLPGGFRPDVFPDGYDSWNFGDPYFQHREGSFTLLPPAEGGAFSGLEGRVLPSVRVIEDGPVRTVAEAVLQYRSSRLLIRYAFPKRGAELRVELRLFWQEKDRVVKLALPTTLREGRHWGQTVWGTDERDGTGREDVSHRWCGLQDGESAVTVINDGTYAASVGAPGELRLTLLRSPAYAASDSNGISALSDSHYTERMDQGERIFHFWFQAGEAEPRLRRVDREAQLHGEAPFALAFCPSGEGAPPVPGLLRLEGESLLLEAMKRAEDGKGYILRIRNPLSVPQEAALHTAAPPRAFPLSWNGFEVKTYRWIPEDGTLLEDSMLA